MIRYADRGSRSECSPGLAADAAISHTTVQRKIIRRRITRPRLRPQRRAFASLSIDDICAAAPRHFHAEVDSVNLVNAANGRAMRPRFPSASPRFIYAASRHFRRFRAMRRVALSDGAISASHAAPHDLLRRCARDIGRRRFDTMRAQHARPMRAASSAHSCRSRV